MTTNSSQQIHYAIFNLLGTKLYAWQKTQFEPCGKQSLPLRIYNVSVKHNKTFYVFITQGNMFRLLLSSSAWDPTMHFKTVLSKDLYDD